ncbi:MAG: hypothetical protein ACYC8T_39255, partial [Myxococcaceae bacterium]
RLGELDEMAEGLFSLPGEHLCASQLALAISRSGRLGLGSALWAEGLLAEEPIPVHLVVPHGTRAPRSRGLPLCVSWARELGEGCCSMGRPRGLVAHHPARALVDCLRYPCGLPRAQVEAIARQAISSSKTSPGKLLDAALEVKLGGEPLRFLESVIARAGRQPRHSIAEAWVPPACDAGGAEGSGAIEGEGGGEGGDERGNEGGDDQGAVEHPVAALQAG